MIPLIQSTFYNEKQTKKKLLKFIWKADHLSFGKECERFEKRFARWQGRKYCVLVNSGSSANLALIQALLNLGKIKKGDKVGFSALTWSTNVMPLIQLGLKPVAIDIELDTLNVSSKTLKKTLSRTKIKFLFLTNLLGFCDDVDEIARICKKNKIIIAEDNCESLGTVYKGEKLGNFGLASTFSFYVGHHLSTIEGGAICTDDEELATMLRLVRAHGWDRNLSFGKQDQIRKKFKVNSTFYSRYTFYELGYNLRPTELTGFIGNTQLDFIGEIIKKRNSNFLRFSKALYSNGNYLRLRSDHIDFLSSFAIPIICKDVETRDKVVKKCKGVIEIRPIVGGDITNQPFFKKHTSKNLNFAKNARQINDCGFYFGNNPELSKKDIKKIIDLII